MRPKKNEASKKKTLMLTGAAAKNLEDVCAFENIDQSSLVSELLTTPRFVVLSSFCGEDAATAAPLETLLEHYINRSCGVLTLDKSLSLMEFFEQVLPNLDFDEAAMCRYISYCQTKLKSLETLEEIGKQFQELAESKIASADGLETFVRLAVWNMGRKGVYDNDNIFRILSIMISSCAQWKDGYSCKDYYGQVKELLACLHR